MIDLVPVRATRSNIHDILKMDAECFPDRPFGQPALLRLLEEGVQHRALVIPEVGYALAWVELELCDVVRLGVRTQHRFKGLGKLLLESITRQDEAILTVRRNNAAALALYKKQGFVPEGFLPDADALVLRRQRKAD